MSKILISASSLVPYGMLNDYFYQNPKAMMKALSIISLLFLPFSLLIAQPLNRSTPETMLKTADEQYQLKNWDNARDWYEKYFNDTKDKSVLYKTADCYFQIRDYVKAERLLSRIVQDKKGKTEAPADVHLVYARVLKMNEKYDDAIAELQQCMIDETDPARKASAAIELEGARMAKSMKPQRGLNVVNAGDKINSKSGDYSASLTKTGDFFFTSYHRDKEIVLDGKQGDYEAKVFAAHKDGSNFTEPQALGTQINREGYQQANVFVTRDGKLMYFTRVQLQGEEVAESQIFYSTRAADGSWSAANEVKGVNGAAYIAKQPALGELFGHEVLYFSANKEGGKGGFDIYYATRKSDGEFSEPVNLGPTINTSGDEDSPFYSDGKLYFSSTGHAGLGGLDVFVSTWNGSEWSKPQNLGPGINSSVNDNAFSIDEKGYHGFVVSNRPGGKSLKSKTCCTDIYVVDIEEPKVDLKALTFEKDKALKGTTLQLIDMTGDKMGKTENKTNANGNDFAFPLEFEKAYSIITTKEGYYSDTTQFNTVGLNKTTTIEKKITLRPLPPIEVIDTITVATNEPIRLNKIYYDYDKWDILPESARELDYLDTLLIQYPDMVIELSSHTDARGKDDYNMTLSQKRAESARTYLLSKGIVPERIKAVGYGETQILNQCVNGVECTDDEHRLNRRTEFKILSGPTSIKIVRKEFQKRTILPPGQQKPEEPKPNKKDTPKKPGGKGGNSVAQQNMPVMTFDKTSVDFGRIKYGEKRTHVYKFKNTGDQALEIDLVSACDCTDVDWTQTPVKPGESGEIKATFNSDRAEKEDMNKPLDKDMTIILKNNHPVSGYPIVYEIKFKVFVEKK